MFEVYLSQNAQEFLNKLDTFISDRIEKRLKRLEETPIPSDSKFIGRENNEKIFRYRIGKFRVLYKIKANTKIILVAKIEKRSKVYD